MKTITMTGHRGTGAVWVANQCKGVDQGHEATAGTDKGTTEIRIKDRDGKANEAKMIQKNQET